MAIFCVGVGVHAYSQGDSGGGGGNSSDDNDRFVCVEFCAAGCRLFEMPCFNIACRLHISNI